MTKPADPRRSSAQRAPLMQLIDGGKVIDRKPNGKRC